MAQTTMQVIITGGPGYGKTTIIQALEEKGFPVQHEFGREIIQREINTGGTKTPWQDVLGFSAEVLHGRVQQYNAIQENEVNFYDRGIPDIVAFMRKDKLEIPEAFTQALNEYKYFPKVFITPPWKEIFIQDEERKEEYELSVEIHEFIYETYSSLGYEVIEIPKLSVAARVEFVLNVLELNKQLS